MSSAFRFDLADPEWLAHRHVEGMDRVRFVHLPRARHRDMPFLIDELIGPDTMLHEEPVSAVLGTVPCETGRPCLLLHSAFCGSTLLVRALDVPGVAMGLSEPVILNDVVGFRRRGAAPRDVARLADAALRLLARPFGPGEAVVIKPSTVVNPLSRLLLALRPDAPCVALYAPLETFLLSVARKGLECRLWARELFEGYMHEGFADFGYSGNEIFRQSDLQIAALGWLAQHRQFAALTAEFGPRVATLDADRLADDPVAALEAVARHYGLALDAAAMAAGPAFTRHSKSGTAYGVEARRADYATAREAYGEEIAKVMTWARVVADTAGIVLEAPNALLPAQSS